jgi:serine/threonine protein kinase
MAAHGSTALEGSRLTRAALAALPRRRLHAGRNRTKAVIDLFTASGPPFVVKDVAPRSCLVRLLLGPWQLSREARAYARLDGVTGIPRFLGVVDRQAIALEYIEGKPLADLPRGSLPAAFFDRLDALLAAMHAKGVAHADLHRGDVLVGPDSRPYVIDFSTSWVVRDAAAAPGRIFRQCRLADLRSAAKLRRRYGPPGAAAPPDRPALYRRLGAVRRLLGGRR